MKPRNKTALIDYLNSNPYLVWRSPAIFSGGGSKVEGRKFLRIQNRRFVFEVTTGEKKGEETYLDVAAKDVEWQEDCFLVRFPDSWHDMAGEWLVYWYLDEPFDEVRRQEFFEKAENLVTKVA